MSENVNDKGEVTFVVDESLMELISWTESVVV